MDFIEWLSEHWGVRPNILWRVFYSLVLLIILGIVRYIILKLINQQIEDVKNKYHWRNVAKYTAFFVGFILIAGIWIKEFASIATFLGLLSAGLVVALRDPVVNLAAWLFILVRKPFKVGDRIQIGGNAGDVIDIRIFQFTINEIGNWVDADQSTGRVIHIPNGLIFRESQASYTQGFSHLWNEIGVRITFESNWEKAKDILMGIVNKHTTDLTEVAKQQLMDASKKFMIFYSTLSPNVYTDVKDSGVMLTMRYICEPKKRRLTEHHIWEDILSEFARHKDINFAYPTQRIYFNPREGKNVKVEGPENTRGMP